MAWVPNGSAMQIAEPWKPLPQPTEEEKKGPRFRDVTMTLVVSTWGGLEAATSR